MLWLIITAGAMGVTYSASREGHKGKNTMGALTWGLFFTFFMSLIVSNLWTQEVRTHTRIVTSIEQAVVNNEPVLMFTTADGKLWSVPSDIKAEVGHAPSLVQHEYTSPQWLWSLFPALAEDYKTLLVTP